jgi:hypothetical protein
MKPIAPLFPRPMLNTSANCPPDAADLWYEQVITRVDAARTVTTKLLRVLEEEWRAEFPCTDEKILRAYHIGRGRY